jgi:hypothetical protein
MQNKFHVAGCHRLPSTAGQTAKADNSVMLFCKLKTKKKSLGYISGDSYYGKY